MKLGIILKKWSLAITIVPILIVVVILKIIFHYKGWEFLSLNPLFTSILAATIFLLGFLISGVLSDYKESEKIPGGLAASLEAVHDEASIIVKARGAQSAKSFLIAGMIIVKIGTFAESLFFVILVSFLTLYMLFLIRDLDNPFDYKGHGEGGSEVSLKPLHDLEERLKEEGKKHR